MCEKNVPHQPKTSPHVTANYNIVIKHNFKKIII